MAIDEDYLKSIGLGEDNISTFLEKLNEHTAAERTAVDNKNRELLGKLAKQKEALGAYEGVDLDRYNEWQEKFSKLEEDDLMDKGKFDELKAQLIRNHETEKNKVLEERDGAVKALQSYIVDAEVTKAISEEKGKQNLLGLVVKSAVKVEQDNGRYSVVVLDENGQTRLNSNGNNMSVREFVQELKTKDDYMPAFDPSGLSGGGAQKASVQRSQNTDNLSPRQKMAAGRQQQ